MYVGGIQIVATLLTETFMKLVKLFGTALVALSLSVPAVAQQSGGQPDQVDQLAQMVGLTDDQQTEIRAIIDEMQGEIGLHRRLAGSGGAPDIKVLNAPSQGGSDDYWSKFGGGSSLR